MGGDYEALSAPIEPSTTQKEAAAQKHRQRYTSTGIFDRGLGRSPYDHPECEFNS
jgi:hypothetical protein